MEIKIKDKIYNVKYSIRSLFIFEQLTGKLFAINTLMDEYIFYYSMILANNPDAVLTFDEFIDYCDEDISAVNELKQYLTDVFTKQSQFNKEEDSSKKN